MVNIIVWLIRLTHFIIVLYPYFALFYHKFLGQPIFYKNWMKYILLFYISIPYQWEINYGDCGLTHLEKKYGKTKMESNSFVITYFGKYIKYLFDMFNIEYNEKNKEKFLYLNVYVSILIIWYLLFF